MKKAVVLIIAMAVMLGMMPVYGASPITVEGEAYAAADNPQVDPSNHASGRRTFILKACSASWNITVPEEGFYTVEVRTAGDVLFADVCSLTAEVDGKMVSRTITAAGGWEDFTSSVLGELEFKSGTNTLTMSAVGVISIDYIKLTPSKSKLIKPDGYVSGEGVSFEGDALEMTSGGYATYGMTFEQDGLYKAEITLTGDVSLSIDGESVQVKSENSEEPEAVVSPIFTVSAGDKEIIIEANSDSAVHSIKIMEATKDELKTLGSIVEIEGESYATATDPQVDPVTAASGGQSFIMKGDASWQVNVSQAGEYAVTVRSAGSAAFAAQAVLAPVANGGTPGEGTVVKAINDWADFGDTEIGTVTLKAGMNTLAIKHSESLISIDKIMLTPAVTDVAPVAAYIGEALVTGEKTYPRGMDRVELYFNALIDETSIGNIKITDETGNEIATEAVSENNAVYLKLKDTPDYDTNYFITADGVKSQSGTSMAEEKQYAFTTCPADSDSGKGILSGTDVQIDKNTVKAGGVVLSGENTGISGRIVTVDIKAPDGSSVEGFPKEYLSGEDGVFEMEETILSDGASGTYTVSVKTEYSSAAENCTLHFISVSDRTAFLKALEETDSTIKVMLVFNNYRTKININPSVDLSNVSVPMNVYGHFVGAQYDEVEDFIADYYKMIAFETLNTATAGSKAEVVLGDEEKCGIIGVDKNKTDLIVNERAGFLADITAIENKATLEEFIPEFEKVTEKWLKAEYSIEKLTVDDTSKSVKTGQGATLNIGFTKPQNNVKLIKYSISASDSAILSGAVVEEVEVYEFEVDGKTAEAVITADAEAADVDTWGNILLTAPNTSGGYTVSISGTVTYDIFGYDVTEEINPVDITVTVTSTTNKLPTGSSSTSSGGGKKPSVAPVIPVEPVTPPADEEFKFDDIDSVSWAKEGIYALLESGIISESEDKKFNPNNNVTRAQFTKMVIELIGGEGTAENTLNDVTGNEWYAPYAAKACSLGIITGDENGNFNADANITRQDMAVILYRTLEYLGKTGEKSEEIFDDDGEIAGYAETAVYVMKNLGIINGVGENKFAPKNNATRAMAAKMIYEFDKVVK